MKLGVVILGNSTSNMMYSLLDEMVLRQGVKVPAICNGVEKMFLCLLNVSL